MPEPPLPPPPEKLSNPPEIIKAVYVTGWSAGSKKYLDYLSNLFNTTEINAVVIDIKDYSGFVNYLSGVWQNRNRYVEISDEISEEEQQAQKIQKQRFFDFSVDGNISARNYVGVVQYEGIRIEVYPKIFSDDDTENVKKWQLNLLYWLTYCRKIKFPFSFADVSKLKFDDSEAKKLYIIS